MVGTPAIGRPGSSAARKAGRVENSLASDIPCPPHTGDEGSPLGGVGVVSTVQ